MSTTSPSRDLRDWLAAAPQSQTFCFNSEMPADPDELTVLRDTPGFPAQDFMGAALPGVQYPGVQVSVRAATWLAAETRAWAAYRALAGLSHATINGSVYHNAKPMQEPFPLGRDEAAITTGGSEGRPIFIFNVQVMRAYA
jgi:hypothetical protein